MRKKILILTSAILLAYNVDVNAQGCSDAGVCSMGNVESNHSYDADSVKNSYHIKLSQGVGLGEQGVINALTSIDLSASIKDFFFQIKVPYAYNSGNLGQVAGLSDISISASYNLKSTEKNAYGLMLGFKLPTNESDLKINGNSAPMPYQTSLGTFDLVVGTNMKLDKYVFALAYQHVLNHNNRNQFIANSFTNTDANNYFTSFLFKRSNDLVFRAERRFDVKNNWSVNPSTLFIYRLQNDQEADISGNYSEIKNSSGLTFNVVMNVSKKFKNENALDLSLAFPLMVRKVRPDGLTRSALIAAAYRFNL